MGALQAQAEWREGVFLGEAEGRRSHVGAGRVVPCGRGRAVPHRRQRGRQSHGGSTRLVSFLEVVHLQVGTWMTLAECHVG